jgi:hypothetical protein
MEIDSAPQTPRKTSDGTSIAVRNERSENNAGQQRHEDEPTLLIVSVRRQTKALLEVRIEINIFFKTDSVQKFVRKRRRLRKEQPSVA